MGGAAPRAHRYRVETSAITAIALVVMIMIAAASAGTTGTPGPSAALGPAATSGCHVRHGHLPDARCTPGAIFTKATTRQICRRGYSESVRDVPYSEKTDVYHAYGMTRHYDGHNGELDHLVSLELGGSNDRANLWPESATGSLGSHVKDKLENRLHDEVCSGKRQLRVTQRAIARNWVRLYHQEFG